MQVGIEGGNTAALVRRYARKLGLKLELQRSAGELVIVAREIQTSIRITDLPGMGEAGSWQSWPDCLAGLKTSKRRF
jgi:hypothetical protein